jgi:hypothetical protein
VELARSLGMRSCIGWGLGVLSYRRAIEVTRAGFPV